MSGPYKIERVPAGYAVWLDVFVGAVVTLDTLLSARGAKACLDEAYALGATHAQSEIERLGAENKRWHLGALNDASEISELRAALKDARRDIAELLATVRSATP